MSCELLEWCPLKIAEQIQNDCQCISFMSQETHLEFIPLKCWSFLSLDVLINWYRQQRAKALYGEKAITNQLPGEA